MSEQELGVRPRAQAPDTAVLSAEDAVLHSIIRSTTSFGVILLPIIAFVDYRLGYYLVAVVALTGALFAPLMLWLSERPRFLRLVVHIVLAYLFVLFSVVAMTKLDSAASIVWLPLAPILFFYLSYFWAGVFWSIGLFVVMVLAYFNYEIISDVAPVASKDLLHPVLAYITSSVFASFYELKKNPHNPLEKILVLPDTNNEQSTIQRQSGIR